MIPPVHSFDPYSPDVQRDPYPHYSALRDTAAVIQTTLDGRPVYVLGRDSDVRAALADWRTFSSRGGLSLHPRDRFQAGVLVATDPHRAGEPTDGQADHTALARTVAPYMSRQAIAALGPRVRAWVNTVVGDLVAAGTFEAVADLARPVPTRVVSDLVGLPEDGREQYADWAQVATALQGPQAAFPADAFAQIGQMQEYVTRLGAQRRFAPDGVGAAVFAAAERHGGISHEEATSIVWGGLIVAGLHTTIAALTWALWVAARHPDQWRLYRDRYRDGDATRGAWTDELLRYEAIFPHGYRTTTVAVTVDGHLIPADARVLLLYGSANRDPRRWREPDRFQPTRPDIAGHLGFGEGVHHCLGQHLVRLEVQAVLDAFAACGVTAFEVGQGEFAPNAAVRGWSRLPVTVVVDG